MKRQMRDEQRMPNVAGTIGVVMMELLLIFLGVAELFQGRFSIHGLCYIVCCLLVIWGIWLMGRYVIKEEYRDIANYGFTVGTAAVVLGIAGLIGVNVLVSVISLCLGWIMLLLAAVMVQNAVQILNCKGKAWGASLIFAIVTFLCALCVLLDWGKLATRHPWVIDMMYIVSGVFSMWSLILAYRRSKRFEREEKRKWEDAWEELEIAEALTQEPPVQEAPASDQPEDPMPVAVEETAPEVLEENDEETAPEVSEEDDEAEIQGTDGKEVETEIQGTDGEEVPDVPENLAKEEE